MAYAVWGQACVVGNKQGGMRLYIKEEYKLICHYIKTYRNSMSAQLIASLIDQSISILGGIVATLIGFRILGPKSGDNIKYDNTYIKWIKHLRWIVPLLIIFTLVQLAVSA